MLNVLIDLLVLVVVSFVGCALFAVIWTYFIDKPYWAWRERLAERKEKRQAEKNKKRLAKR